MDKLIGQDLIDHRNQLIQGLYDAKKDMEEHGLSMCNWDNKYNKRYAQVFLKHKAAGVPATILDKLTKTDDEVIEYAYKRDIENVLFKVAQEAINNLKKELESIENQIEREWGRR